MMMKKTKGMENGLLVALCFGFFLSGSVIRVFAHDNNNNATEQQCGEYFQNLMTCLDYAKGKITTPSKECCSAMKGIKDSDPKCLCYIFQQAHTGSDVLKNMGVQEAKLLELPSACQLQNASITKCPKVLGLSPSSPDAAIFLNASSSSATPATPVVKGGASALPDKADGSSVTMHGTYYLVGSTVIITMAIFFYAFPSGVASFCF